MVVEEHQVAIFNREYVSLVGSKLNVLSQYELDPFHEVFKSYNFDDPLLLNIFHRLFQYAGNCLNFCGS